VSTAAAGGEERDRRPVEKKDSATGMSRQLKEKKDAAYSRKEATRFLLPKARTPRGQYRATTRGGVAPSLGEGRRSDLESPVLTGGSGKIAEIALTAGGGEAALPLRERGVKERYQGRRLGRPRGYEASSQGGCCLSPLGRRKIGASYQKPGSRLCEGKTPARSREADTSFSADLSKTAVVTTHHPRETRSKKNRSSFSGRHQGQD